MTSGARLLLLILVGLGAPLSAPPARADQSGLAPHTEIVGPSLDFDWPALEIGIGSYEEGPTGLTLIRFAHKASVAIDVRGGAPGTVNADLLRLVHARPVVDAIVFAGGSAYGEEAITAVMTGLKQAGEGSGDWNDIAIAAGAIIYDFGARLNEIYPDQRLALAALHDLRPGRFPLGAQGAGRMAMQGGFFGCAAHSGEGGAFRQIGDTKVAAFVVVNAAGAITDRDGRIVSCHRNPAWGDLDRTSDLLARAINFAAAPPSPAPSGPTRNTTISLVVTNRRMALGDLERLAVQVHTSMARAIQPFSTYNDGDTLFAASTEEIGNPDMRPGFGMIDVIAAETMWDAILASVPDDRASPAPTDVVVSAEQLACLVGRYRMGPRETVEIARSEGGLTARLDGSPFFDLGAAPQVLHAITGSEFRIDSRYGTRFAFTAGPGCKATGLTIDPGRWAQRGERIEP